MALDAVTLELRDRLRRLAGALAVLRQRIADGCPDRAHYLYGRMHDAVPVVEGWLRKAKRAARSANEQDTAAVRRALSRFDHSFGKLRQELRRELTGRNRVNDLADLGRRRKRTWTVWVGEVEPAVVDVRRATTAVSKALGACWRELAGQPSAGVVVNNTMIATRGRISSTRY